jgi:Putative zinc-finger
MLIELNQRHCRCEMSAGSCPEENTLAAFVSHNLTPAEMAEVEAHLSRCGDCCEVVAFVVRCGADLPDFPFTPSMSDPSE